jgi:hypothetical protein
MEMFRIVFWDVLPCKIISEVRTASIIRQYIPEDNSEHHTRRRENLKSHKNKESLQFLKVILVRTLLSLHTDQL